MLKKLCYVLRQVVLSCKTSQKASSKSPYDCDNCESNSQTQDDTTFPQNVSKYFAVHLGDLHRHLASVISRTTIYPIRIAVQRRKRYLGPVDSSRPQELVSA